MRKPVDGMEQTLIGLAKAFSIFCFPASRLENMEAGQAFQRSSTFTVTGGGTGCTQLLMLRARVVMRLDDSGRLGLAVVRYGEPVDGLAPGVCCLVLYFIVVSLALLGLRKGVEEMKASAVTLLHLC